MSVNGLGTFRQGQWQQFRRFVLNERRDVLARIAVIKAELDRIGFIRVANERYLRSSKCVTSLAPSESFKSGQ